MKSPIIICLLFTLLNSCVDKEEGFASTHIPINNPDISVLLTNIRSQILERFKPKYSGSDIEIIVQSYIPAFQNDGSWDDIKYDDQFGMAYWEPIAHLERIEQLSVAYFLSQLYHNDYTIEIVNKALDYWRNNEFVSKNWWFNTIGACSIIGEVLILLDGHITDENWNYYVNYINKLQPEEDEGANRVDIARYHFYRGVCLGNDSIISKCTRLCFESLAYKQHTGIQVDGSSLMYDMRYIGGYGEDMFSGIIRLGLYVLNTDFALQKSEVKFLSDYFLNTYFNALRGGIIDYAALGRAIVRPNYLKRIALLPLLNGMLKLDNTNQDEYSRVIAELFEVNKNPTNSNFSHFFWKAEYLLQCNERYNISVGGTSKRVKKPEKGNGENLLGTLLSLGTTTFRVNGDEYFNIFPCWNWSKIPGVTSTNVVPEFEEDWGVYGGTNLSGGVSDGIESSYAFLLDDYGLRGRKGYYTTKDGLICMGNSLESMNRTALHTTVEQCLYRGNYEIFRNKEGKACKVLHNNIWYILFAGEEFNVVVEEVSGNWKSIKENESDEIVVKSVFSILMNHSQINSYAYMVLPNPSNCDEVDMIHGNIEILSNNANLQALVDKMSSILYLTFFSSGLFMYDDCAISVDKPCMIMVKNIYNEIIDLYIAEPTQLEKSIILNINGREQMIDLPAGDYAGSTVKIQFEKK